MRIIHLSDTTRTQGFFGGVPRFGYYLWKWMGANLRSMYDVHLDFDDDTLVIADNQWVENIPVEIPVIGVLHGCAAENAERNNTYNEMGIMIEQQKAAARRPNTLWVACSKYSDDMCFKHYDDKSFLRITSIHSPVTHGLPLDLYKPDGSKLKKVDRPIVIHDCRGENKGEHVIPVLSEQITSFEFKHVQEGLAKMTSFEEDVKKYYRGDIYMSISRSEGNSYALLAAMACGIPVLATNTGVFYDDDIVQHNIAEVIRYHDRDNVDVVRKALESTWKNRKKRVKNALKWMQKYASKEAFIDNWNTITESAWSLLEHGKKS